jgi:anti-anti-sigma factor
MENTDIEILEEEHGLFYLVKIKGSFRAKNVPQIRSRMEYSLNLGHTKFAMDLSEVNFMDSTGIGFIVNLFKNIQKLEGTLVIINPSESVLKILNISSLARCLDIRSNVGSPDTLFD